MLHNIVWCHCVQLVLHLGVNRGIRTILPPYATGASLFLIPTLTQETFSSHKMANVYVLLANNEDILVYFGDICIPNREVVYLPEQMTRVTLALCIAPYDCGAIVRMVFIYRVVTLYRH